MYITQKIYNIITEVIKRRFRRYKEVKAIYLRGSVSTGDVVLGKSDIDLVVLIDKFEDPLKEARFLYFLGKEYLKLKRIFPAFFSSRTKVFLKVLRTTQNNLSFLEKNPSLNASVLYTFLKNSI